MNIFDVLSRLGGVFSALSAAGLVFTSIFSHKLMMSSLIGKLFHFRGGPPNQVEKVKRKQKYRAENRIFIPKKRKGKCLHYSDDGQMLALDKQDSA